MRKKTEDLALELDAVLEDGADPELIAECAAELRRLNDEVSKAVKLARIRQQRITQLETAISNLHKVRGRYNTQIAAAELFALCGLSTERPTK